MPTGTQLESGGVRIWNVGYFSACKHLHSIILFIYFTEMGFYVDSCFNARALPYWEAQVKESLSNSQLFTFCKLIPRNQAHP